MTGIESNRRKLHAMLVLPTLASGLLCLGGCMSCTNLVHFEPVLSGQAVWALASGDEPGVAVTQLDAHTLLSVAGTHTSDGRLLVSLELESDGPYRLQLSGQSIQIRVSEDGPDVSVPLHDTSSFAICEPTRESVRHCSLSYAEPDALSASSGSASRGARATVALKGAQAYPLESDHFQALSSERFVGPASATVWIRLPKLIVNGTAHEVAPIEFNFIAERACHALRD